MLMPGLMLIVSGIFFVFFFLDFLHESFMKIKVYRNSFNYFLKKLRNNGDKMAKTKKSSLQFETNLSETNESSLNMKNLTS